MIQTLENNSRFPVQANQKNLLFDPVFSQKTQIPDLVPNQVKKDSDKRLLNSLRLSYIKDLFRQIPKECDMDPFLTSEKHEPQIHQRIQEVVASGAKILPKELHKECTTIDQAQYESIRKAIFHFYQETSPTIKGNETGKVWSPEVWGEDRLQYRPIEELSDKERRAIQMWWEWDIGLIDHTFIAAEFMKELLLDMQHHLTQLQVNLAKEGKSLSNTQREILACNPYQYAIKMLFHDLGRLVTHDRQGHEHMTQEILAQIGVHEDWRKEPSIIECFVAELPVPVTSIAQTNAIGNIYHYVDVVSKGDTRLQRPQMILDRIQDRKKYYGEGLTEAQRHTSRAYYAEYEAKTMLNILYWFEAQEGLSFPNELLYSVYEKVEKYMLGMRAELGLLPPNSQK